MELFRCFRRSTGWIVLDPEGDYVQEFKTEDEALAAMKELMGKAEVEANEKQD